MPVCPVILGQRLADPLHQSDARPVGAPPVNLATGLHEAALGPGEQERARRVERLHLREIDHEMLRPPARQSGEDVAQLAVEKIRLVDHPFAEGPEEQPILVEDVVDRCFHILACFPADLWPGA